MKTHAPSASEAVLEYRDASFRIVKPGSFVRCAVTGESITLENLRYWSVARQEPYASPQAVFTALGLEQPKAP